MTGRRALFRVDRLAWRTRCPTPEGCGAGRHRRYRMRQNGVGGSRQDALAGAGEVWSWLAFGILQIGAISVFWLFDALPFMDLPAHAGILALKHRFDPAGFEGKFFIVFQHLGPYSLFSGLGEVFTAWFGANAAVRLLATL